MALPILLALFAVINGCLALRRALRRENYLLEEFGFALAHVFLVGSSVWLAAFLGGRTLLGFGEPWTWLTAAHFAAAGFGALTVTSLCCRVVSRRLSLRILRAFVLLHVPIYLTVAAGISGSRTASLLGTGAYALLFPLQLLAVLMGGPYRMENGPMRCLQLALAVPLGTIALAVMWAIGRPWFDLSGMVKYHGLVNALGHVGLGLFAFAWGRPPAHRAPAQALPSSHAPV